MKNKYVAMVLLAGSLWGFMGFFRRTLDSMGVSAIGCIAVRCIFAAAPFGIVLLVSDRQAFKIKLKDIWIFFGSGIVSLFVFGVCYFKAMDYMSLSAAAILLYTAPCFVILFSALLFKEKLTGQKLAAMLLSRIRYRRRNDDNADRPFARPYGRHVLCALQYLQPLCSQPRLLEPDYKLLFVIARNDRRNCNRRNRVP